MAYIVNFSIREKPFDELRDEVIDLLVIVLLKVLDILGVSRVKNHEDKWVDIFGVVLFEALAMLEDVSYGLERANNKLLVFDIQISDY